MKCSNGRVQSDDSDWYRNDDDVRRKFGLPPKGNANYGWVQHFIHHLAPKDYAGFVLANGSLSSNQSVKVEAAIRSDLEGLGYGA